MKQVIVFGSLNMDLTIRCERMPQQGETVEGSNFLNNPVCPVSLSLISPQSTR